MSDHERLETLLQDADDWSARIPEAPGHYHFFHPFSDSVRIMEVREHGGRLFARREDDPSWKPLNTCFGLWSGPIREVTA